MNTDVFSKETKSTGTMYASRCRLRGMSIAHGSTAGSVIFRDGGASGDVIATIHTPAATGMENVLVPANGLLFETDVHVTLSNVTSITAFFS